ncbi:alpha-N-acetylgalactosaminidase-like [Drosophila novamexicana]|uniref:alpha-N-acetylgalactosaminidase-like n=1 Tax=Drosophila novamexicana TaxID=47314 RepID=UPI0011E5BE5E|nr:alpha-N-acetylgalactosaminidase-like [Drosophila novamexicana]
MSREDCYSMRLALVARFLWLCSVVGLENGLARTPPMGWMPFERFRCVTDCVKFPRDCISESLFMRTADLLVSEGYSAVGYEYLIIDDCWMERQRHEITKELMPDRERFPRGLYFLSDYIHNKGLKFGLYHDIGERTCMHFGPGAKGYYALDAKTFAIWNVDYVKLDGCFIKNINLDIAYPAFGRELNKTGRPMVYSCSWPYYQKHPNYELIKKHCNLWRFADDIRDSFDSVGKTMYNYYKQQNNLTKHAGPGHWNDPDMLVLGNYRLSYDASRLQLAIWAILAAPLIMTNDLQTVRPEIKTLLQNRAIIEVDQDPLGIPGRCVYIAGSFQIWVRPVMPFNNMGAHSYAVAFVNIGNYEPCPLCPQTHEVVLERLGLKNDLGYKVIDLFDSIEDLGLFKPKDTFITRINPSGVTFFKFTAVDMY